MNKKETQNMDLDLINKIRHLLKKASPLPWDKNFYVKNDTLQTDEWFANRELILLLVNNSKELLDYAELGIDGQKGLDLKYAQLDKVIEVGNKIVELATKIKEEKDNK